MDQKTLTPDLIINNIQFYKHPYLDILIATNPHSAINDLWQIWLRLIKTAEDAAEVLTITLDRCRKCSFQTLVYIEYPDYLPEVHRLASAVLALEQVDQLYFTPIINSVNYSPERLLNLFGLNPY
jgi:hypothetical protein